MNLLTAPMFGSKHLIGLVYVVLLVIVLMFIYKEKNYESNKKVFDVLKEKLDSERLKFQIIKDSQHIVEDWEKRFPEIIKYLFNG